jgi:hypothetical protein
MSFCHYYYAFNRRTTEGILDLTWSEFLKKFGWRPDMTQWKTLGEFLAFSLYRLGLPEKPTSKQLVPIPKWTIRKTIQRSSGPYFILGCLGDQLGKQSFLTMAIDAERMEDDCDGILACAAKARLRGSINDRTLWAVLALHEGCGYMVPEQEGLERAARSRVINNVWQRFGRCRPVFDWQTAKAVRDGHTALREKDTLLFARFLQLAWRRNWPVAEGKSGASQRFRDIELARMLRSSAPELRGQCIIRYWGC